MAQFKVGQRVRLIRVDNARNAHLLGREATITAIPAQAANQPCAVLVDGYDARSEGFLYPDLGARFDQLAPLDPRCSEFLADMERFAHLADKRPLGEILKERTT